MAEEDLTSCANCGKGEEFEAKLKKCTACKLVKYCSKECQIAHRPHHKKACKKRAAELIDEALFREPPTKDDCPICFLPLPSLESGHLYMPCCSKIICAGCSFEHSLQSSGYPTCPFCRADTPSAKEHIKMLEKRLDSNDANTIFQLGQLYFFEDCGVKKDLDTAMKWFHRAAALGSAPAYHNLANMYYLGYNVSRDDMKAKQYYEKAAMAGCAASRLHLGNFDADAGSFDRAIKHWLIAASCGDIRSVNHIKNAMVEGVATRDHYAQALRGYTQYLDEVRSEQRDRAAAYSDEYKYLFEAPMT